MIVPEVPAAPAEQWVCGSEGQSKQMVSRASGSGYPLTAAVYRSHDYAACSGNNCARLVLNVETVERRGHGRKLRFPLEPAIACMQNCAIAAHRQPCFMSGANLTELIVLPCGSGFCHSQPDGCGCWAINKTGSVRPRQMQVSKVTVNRPSRDGKTKLRIDRRRAIYSGVLTSGSAIGTKLILGESSG